MKPLDIITELSEMDGASGDEQRIAALIAKQWEPLTDEVRTDRVGSLVAVKRGSGDFQGERRKRVLLSAHMDEIGLMVKQVIAHPDESGYGFLRVINVGGIDRRLVFGQRVMVHGRQDIPGVIGGLPRHMQADNVYNKPYGYDDMFIDVGMSYEALREQVDIGDFVTFRQSVQSLHNKRIAGKAFDNRASVAAVTMCLEQLQRQEHSWDVVAVATVQEETLLLGAGISGFAEAPDIAVALDVTIGKGPGAKVAQTFDLNGGPVLDEGVNIHPGMLKALRDAAADLEMKTQLGIHTRASGTDAHAIQVAGPGVPTGLISIPLRYMHSPVETIAIKDVVRAGRLLATFITRLDDQFVDSLADAFFDD